MKEGLCSRFVVKKLVSRQSTASTEWLDRATRGISETVGTTRTQTRTRTRRRTRRRRGGGERRTRIGTRMDNRTRTRTRTRRRRRTRTRRQRRGEQDQDVKHFSILFRKQDGTLVSEHLFRSARLRWLRCLRLFNCSFHHFLIQNPPFLIQNPSFVIQNSTFTP